MCIGEYENAMGRRAMLIEILGSGCPKCYEAERRARRAVQLAGLDAEVSHVHDARAIAQRGVLATPAVAVDGAVKLSGRLPAVAELVTLFVDHAAAAEAAEPAQPRDGTAGTP
jgi:small redox-active disulfide protein 2